MAVHSRVTQDRRHLSRVPALLECGFTDGEAVWAAVIVDLSLNGAFLSSTHLPPKGRDITIFLSPSELKTPLILQAKVTRGGYGTSEHGRLSRFAVKFQNPPLGLMDLLKKLVSGERDRVPGKTAPCR